MARKSTGWQKLYGLRSPPSEGMALDHRPAPSRSAANRARKEAMDKEFALTKCEGPHSTPERHYPQTIKAIPYPKVKL